MKGVWLPVCSIFFSALLLFVFFYKKRVPLLENKLYGIMLIANFFDSIIVTILQILPNKLPLSAIEGMVSILNKIDFLILITFLSCFFLYVVIISGIFKNENTNYKLIKKFPYMISILFIIILFLKVNIITIDGNFSVSGSAITFTYIIALILILLSIIIALINVRKTDKRYIPVYSIILLIVLILILFSINPYLIIISIAFTFFDYLMYFTIENPDVKMLEALNIAKSEAEKANNAKTDFLSSMSHEIRTPLNAIVNFSHSILEEKTLSSVKEDAKYIISASDNLLELVNGILDISKIEAGKIEIVEDAYNIKEVLNDLVVLSNARLGHEKPVKFNYKFDETLPSYLYGDSYHVKQICLNLLTNAIKYTKEGSIDFECNFIKKGDIVRLILSVEDTGIGIKEENISKLFNKFERMDLEKNMTIEGTGLGLAITKSLVELMNGKIVVQSKYGEGSKFTVSIDQKIAKEPIKKQIIKKEPIKKTFKNKKILLVDDNNLNIKVAEKVLSEFEISPVSVTSGLDAIKEIKQEKQYDLILLDDMMPHMSGVETLHELKKMENFNIPVVALTANAIAGMKENYLKEGFNDYLAKPIDKKELIKILNKYL